MSHTVLPITAKVNGKNHLEIGGCDCVDLAKEFGTPLFVMDEEHLRSQCRRFIRAFSGGPVRTEVIYASKAFISVAMCQLVNEEGLSLDVSSGGELYLALESGFPAAKVFMHGNNKTPDELKLALEKGVVHIVVDSYDELFLLNKLAGSFGKRQKILLRITPGIKPDTHSYVQTGQVDSKFGFGLQDGIALEAVKTALSLSNLELDGIHAHIGSQIFVLHSYAKAVEIIMSFLAQVKDETGVTLGVFNAGGGLGIKYKVADEPSTIEEFASVILGGVEREATRLGLPVPKVMVEPGRAIVGNAGVTLYTVGTIKEIPGVRTYISVDGGMSDNMRPMLYDAVYEAYLANRMRDKKTDIVTIAGKHCETGDVLVKDALLPAPAVGDVLTTLATGAYGYVMANNYNKQPRPAVVLVEDGSARVIIARESYEDLVRLERPLR
ncbi:MAG: diaminopimelate decarboxylase [Actinobacteria bacterium]|nr:diaminopimelate decarboxylase [Actinomycetota bacterium]